MGAERYTLHHGDCLQVMAQMDVDSVDAVVTDPPYGLEFMGKEWDKLAVPKAGNLGGFADGNKPSFERVKRHLPAMQGWHTAWATETLRVLKPSHYLLAFGGTRTWHRLACALEDAGFEIRDTLMWLYGSGFPKGKSCLKPAWEPIILARKPGPMRELGIEECRVDSLPRLTGTRNPDASAGSGASLMGSDGRKQMAYDANPPSGRWPANLILDEEAGAMLDGQTGNRPGGGNIVGGRDPGYGGGWSTEAKPGMADSGGASRFFYCAKASRAERNAGCEGMPTRPSYMVESGGKGYENSDGANRGARETAHQNHHPTVKPVALMRWLVRLVARPGEVVLDPFMGSGTTGVACVEEGRNFVGIEKEAEYVEISRARIEAAAAQLRLV